jgi:hypothetical protein
MMGRRSHKQKYEREKHVILKGITPLVTTVPNNVPINTH